MSDPFIAEIRIFAGNFPPRGNAFCDGQLLPISQHTALFALVGTTYGGDGRTTLGLPDLRSRIPLHAGRGPGLSERRLGEKGGTETVALTGQQLPTHTHALRGSTDTASSPDPTGGVVGISHDSAVFNRYFFGTPGTVADMHPAAVETVGTSTPVAHENVQPSLVVNFIIALVGTFPSRD